MIFCIVNTDVQCDISIKLYRENITAPYPNRNLKCNPKPNHNFLLECNLSLSNPQTQSRKPNQNSNFVLILTPIPKSNTVKLKKPLL